MEITYKNKKIYKQKEKTSNVASGEDFVTEYFFSDFDPIAKFISIKRYQDGTTHEKTYKTTKALQHHLGMNGGVTPLFVSNEGVDMWVAVGESSITSNYENYFVFSSVIQLQNICNKYNLKFPIPDDIVFDDSFNGDYLSLNLDDKAMGSVTFSNNGEAIECKVYRFNANVPS